MLYTLTAAFVLLLAIGGYETKAYHFYSQEEVGYRPRYQPRYHNNQNRRNCRNSTECGRWHCCARANSQGLCQPLALPSLPCSNEQIKGNCYAHHCPCIMGYALWLQ
uniref:Ixodegrin B n=1 Tax=Rhipicephalus appendiculatus TaxID=34631 RepID=A0A131YI13_RHIAP